MEKKPTTIVPFFDLKELISSEQSDLLEVISNVLHDGQYIGGRYVSDFENQFAHYLGVKHFVGVGNGLDAIRLLLEAHNIGKGDEVIVPAFTYYATWLAVSQTGATLVPVDVDPSTASINANLIEQSITNRTKAILTVNLYGIPSQLKKLKEISQKYNLALFEDCAQSHGAISDIGMTGAETSGGAFSFYPTKNLGALGDAGGISTNDDSIAAILRSRRSYGQGASKYDHVDTGWNSRLDPIQAAVLSQHLSKLPTWTERRIHIAKRYRDALGELSSKILIGHSTAASSVWHHFVLKVQDRQQWQNYFEKKGISTDIHYPYSIKDVAAIHPWVNDVNVQHPHSEELAETVLSFPMGPWMSDEQIEFVAEGLSEFSEKYLSSRQTMS